MSNKLQYSPVPRKSCLYPGTFPEKETTVSITFTIAVKHKTTTALNRAKRQFREMCNVNHPMPSDETDPHRFSYRVLRGGERRAVKSTLVTGKIPKSPW